MSSISEAVRMAGVVGAGGAGFPTHIKLNQKAEWVIGNGAECEPLLRVDQQMARLYARKLIRGLEIAREAVGARRAGIALKHKYHDALHAVRRAAAGTTVEVYELQDFYPAGDEFNLVYEVTGRVIPEAGRPTDVGCLVQNVVTLLQIVDAVDNGKPVTARPVTIGGAVARPMTLEVPLGTPFTFCLDAAGGATETDYVVVDGGPMMGKFADPATAAVSKRTSGFLVFPRRHPYAERRLRTPDEFQSIARAACDQCNLCTEYCPRNLLGHRCWPRRVMRAGLSATPISEDVITASLCCECGMCSLWACPIPLPVREIMAETRRAMRRHNVQGTFRNREVEVSPFIANRKVPVKAIIERLGLKDYDQPAPVQGMPPQPGRVLLPLDGHAGAPAHPIKRIGDLVEQGEVVAEPPAGAVGARCHAPINGRILRISGNVMEIISS